MFHAVLRIKERKIHHLWIEEAIKFPDVLRKVTAKIYAIKKLNGRSIEVVYIKEKYRKIITVYWLLKMEIIYNKDADALYIRLKEGIVKINKKVNDGVILDIDENDNVLSIELLFVSEKIPLDSLANIQLKNLIQLTK